MEKNQDNQVGEGSPDQSQEEVVHPPRAMMDWARLLIGDPELYQNLETLSKQAVLLQTDSQEIPASMWQCPMSSRNSSMTLDTQGEKVKTAP